MTEILERGNVFFLYRPRVQEEDPAGRKDVQRLHMILDPHGEKKMRRMVLGEKRLPEIRDGGQRNWAFVDEVTASKKQMSGKAAAEEYETKTRGERRQPAERPAAEGVYAIAEHNDHTHFAYALELPGKTGEVQKELNIEEEGSFIMSVKNPEKSSPKGAGLGEHRKADLPKKLQERFKDRRFIPAQPEFLEQEGVEVVLVGAGRDVSDELGIELNPADEDEENAEILRKLYLPEKKHPREPLLEGDWE